MPDLCPKGADLGVKPSAPSCTFPRVGLPSEHTEDQDTLPGGVASVLVEITVKITQRIQKVHRSL